MSVSKLASLGLSQAMQNGITSTRNQTKLAFGFKLHHKFGSSNLIHILNGHGYTVSYADGLRFCKSAAKYSVTMLFDASDNGVHLDRLTRVCLI